MSETPTVLPPIPLEKVSETEETIRRRRDDAEYGKFYGKILLASVTGLVACTLLSITFSALSIYSQAPSWEVEFFEMIFLLGIPFFFLLSLVLWILSFFISAKIRYRTASAVIFLISAVFLAVCFIGVVWSHSG